MDATQIVSLISNIGFPIACVMIMFNMLNKERDDHKEEMAKVTEAVNNNTTVLRQILTKIGVDV